MAKETFLYVAIFHTRNPSKQNPERERKLLCFEKWESELASVARGRNGANIYSHCKIGAGSLVREKWVLNGYRVGIKLCVTFGDNQWSKGRCYFLAIGAVTNVKVSSPAAGKKGKRTHGMPLKGAKRKKTT